MSFSFTGVGTKADVIRQVRSHHIAGDGIGQKARELVVAALEMDKTSEVHNGGDYGYIVKAFGHAGPGTPSSVTITIEPVWIPIKIMSGNACDQETTSEEFREQPLVDGVDLGIGEPADAGFSSDL